MAILSAMLVVRFFRLTPLGFIFFPGPRPRDFIHVIHVDDVCAFRTSCVGLPFVFYRLKFSFRRVFRLWQAVLPHLPLALNMCLGDGVYSYGSYQISAAFALSVCITIVIPTLEISLDHQQPRCMLRPRDVLHSIQSPV